MEPNDPRLVKLPKWAQELISRLEYERDNAIKTLEDTRLSQPPSCVSFVHQKGEEFYLPEGTTIRFRDATGLWVDVCVNSIGTGVLGPVVKVYGQRHLSILPQSANHFYVRGDKA